MASKPKEKILKLEDVLVTKSADSTTTTEETPAVQKNKVKPQKSKKVEIVVPKGRPKSGRIWKSERNKFSSIIKTKGLRNSAEKKLELRKELLRVKQLSREAKAAKDAEQEAKRERRRENLKRQEANRKKSEIVQVIKNTSKIKKMRKKALRFIEKRDTTKIDKN